jgi:ubiquinone/menaquinone biosynthesis C-methylase UbiE
MENKEEKIEEVNKKNEKFWNEEFSKENFIEYDWFLEYEGLKETFSQIMKKSDIILQIGCGTSNLTPDMNKDGYEDITNIDISEVAIKRMSSKYAEIPNLKWVVGNLTNLQFEKEKFDVVLDKGVLDSILFRNKEKDSAMIGPVIISEVMRVLKENGKFVVITMRKKVPFNEELNVYERKRIKIDILSKIPVESLFPTDKPRTYQNRVFVYVFTKKFTKEYLNKMNQNVNENEKSIIEGKNENIKKSIEEEEENKKKRKEIKEKDENEIIKKNKIE